MQYLKMLLTKQFVVLQIIDKIVLDIFFQDLVLEISDDQAFSQADGGEMHFALLLISLPEV